MGNWMTNTACAYLAYALTKNVFAVGFLTFANQIPILVLGPLGGVLGDRMDRRRLLVGLQCACLLLSAFTACMLSLDRLTFTMLVSIASLRGLVNAAEFPSRQSFLVNLVEDKADLSNAIALNSSLFNVARLIGPSVAGALIVFAGVTWCFVLDALSFLAAIAGLLALRVPRPGLRPTPKHPFRELYDGVLHVRDRRGLLGPLFVVPVIAFSGFCTTILAPVFASEEFGGDARSLGWLLSAMGAGALASALLLGWRKSTLGLERWIWQGALLTGVAMCGFACSPSLWLALVFLVANGMGAVLCLAGSNTLLQSRVEDSMRGRVMGLFVMGQGLYPLGSLASGSLASLFGVRGAVFCLALVALAAALGFRAYGCVEPVSSSPCEA